MRDTTAGYSIGCSQRSARVRPLQPCKKRRMACGPKFASLQNLLLCLCDSGQVRIDAPLGHNVPAGNRELHCAFQVRRTDRLEHHRFRFSPGELVNEIGFRPRRRNHNDRDVV